MKKRSFRIRFLNTTMSHAPVRTLFKIRMGTGELVIRVAQITSNKISHYKLVLVRAKLGLDIIEEGTGT